MFVPTLFSSRTVTGSAPTNPLALSVSIAVAQLSAVAATLPVVLEPLPRLICALALDSESVRFSMPVSDALLSVAVMPIHERPSPAATSVAFGLSIASDSLPPVISKPGPFGTPMKIFVTLSEISVRLASSRSSCCSRRPARERRPSWPRTRSRRCR